MGRLIPAGAPARVRCKFAVAVEDECDDEDRDAIQSWLDAGYSREAITGRMANAFDVGMTTARKHLAGGCTCSDATDLLYAVRP